MDNIYIYKYKKFAIERYMYMYIKERIYVYIVYPIYDGESIGCASTLHEQLDKCKEKR